MSFRETYGQRTELVEPSERVLRGLLGAAGAALAVGLVVAGLMASTSVFISVLSLGIPYGMALAYELAAGRRPRRGLGPFVLVAALGVYAVLLAAVATDAWALYDQGVAAGPEVLTRADLVREQVLTLDTFEGSALIWGVCGVIGLGLTIWGAVRES